MRYLWLGLLLGACAGDPALYALRGYEVETRHAAGFKTAVLRTVSLPAYAAAEDMAIEGPDGAITTVEGAAWADLPDRAATLMLSRYLNAMTDAVIGPEPWPLEGVPDAAIDVRISDMIARQEGAFLLAGQYFVGGDPARVRARARAFSVTVPLTGTEPGMLAEAASSALRHLAEVIAADLAGKAPAAGS